MARVTRRAFLHLVGATAAGTAVPACFFGGGSAATAEKPAVKGAAVDEHGAPAAGAKDEHGAADEHGGKAAELWAKSGGDDILKGKTFQTLFNGLPTRAKAFELKDTAMRCIDEGCPGGIHLAGSGCLYEKAAEDYKGKVSGIYTHDGCGAAKLYCDQKGIKTDNPDGVADELAKKLADKLGVPFLGRIKAAQMARPSDMHDARALYYDGTGKLDPSQVQGLPKGFVVSRKFMSDPGYALAEVEVAIGIARGDHGFGDLFKPNAPFYLVAVGGTPDAIPLATMAAELKGMAEHFDDVAVHVIDASPAGAQAAPASTVIRQTAAPAKPGAEGAKPGGESAKPGASSAKPAVVAPAKPLEPLLPDERPSFGPTYLLKDRIVNLADPGGRRYLRFSAAIEFALPEDEHAAPTPAKKKAEAAYQLMSYVPDEEPSDLLVTEGKDPDKAFQARIKKYVPAIEDSVMTIMSGKTYDDIRSLDGKDQAKREIRARIQSALGDVERVTNVFFTEFVIQ